MNSLRKVLKDTLEAEKNSIQVNLENLEFIDQLIQAAKLLNKSSSRITVTGMGKSGFIARKVAATLTSTGSSAIFLHPAEALHGDIGNVLPKEVVIAFSNSGETREIVELLPHIRFLRAKLIAITQKEKSTLSKEADISIVYKITHEGCPLNLAPMASTTVSLAIGDALAALLMKLKNFKIQDFGKFHPSGSLGKRLLTRVKDVMQKDENVILSRSIKFKEVLSKMVSSNLGAAIVVGSKGHLRGIITDGDLKRILDKFDTKEIWKQEASNIMKENPLFVNESVLIEEALSLMQSQGTYILPVIKNNKIPCGIVRMHDIVTHLSSS